MKRVNCHRLIPLFLIPQNGFSYLSCSSGWLVPPCIMSLFITGITFSEALRMFREKICCGDFCKIHKNKFVV